uniref:non-specific serine/threonine protein kinase n=1 Tax=Gongylonema pulchrum TaxID=637853 RepID=A0A183E116_9BILA
LLEKSATFEMLTDVMPFLAHPNEYLRMTTVNILSVLDTKYGVADMLCKVMPNLEPYTTEPLIRLRHKFAVAAILKPCIPRPIWTFVVDHSPVKALLNFLTDKQMYIAMDGGPDSMFATSRRLHPVSPQLESCLKRLENLGIDHNIEDKLTRFENIITKMHDFRTSLGAAYASENNGTIDLIGSKVKLRKFDLSNGQKATCVKATTTDNKVIFEWKNIFGNGTALTPNFAGFSELPEARDTLECVLSTSGFSSLGIDRTFAVRSSACGVMLSELLTHKKERYSKRQQLHPVIYSGSSSALSSSSVTQLPSPRVGSLRSSACGVMLSELLTHKKERYSKRQQLHPVIYSGSSSALSSSSVTQLPSPRVGSRLICHLHEHKAPINRLAQNANGSHFASAGNDGAVKLWSLNRIQGEFNTAIRADATILFSSQQINSVQFLGETGSHLAVASEDCGVSIVDAQRNQSLVTIAFNKDEEGSPVDIIAVDNLLYVLTHHSNIYCVDCRLPEKRKPKPLWQYRIKNEYGLITSFCIDTFKQNWMCFTSTNRYIILWDLRFGIEVNSWPHPCDSCRMLRCWPAYPLNEPRSLTDIWTASSSAFELSRWNLETAQRTHVIWPFYNGRQPLDYSKDDRHVTTALATCPSTGRIFTGDSLGALRSYNLSNPKECFYLSGPLKRTAEAISSVSASKRFASITYNKSVKDTVEILSESVSGATVEPLYCVNPLEVQVSNFA